MLCVFKIDWSDCICKSRIYNVSNTNLLDEILEKYCEVLDSELQSITKYFGKTPFFLKKRLRPTIASFQCWECENCLELL